MKINKKIKNELKFIVINFNETFLILQLIKFNAIFLWKINILLLV
jgi:hypothetical protein